MTIQDFLECDPEDLLTASIIWHLYRHGKHRGWGNISEQEFKKLVPYPDDAMELIARLTRLASKIAEKELEPPEAWHQVFEN